MNDSGNIHQLDRIEAMLTKLADAHFEDDTKINRSDMRRMVINLFGDMLNERKIEAIRNYRQLTGEGLKESKDAVERIMPHLPKQKYPA